jgi:NAD(P)-dependent dehydrogenase (short-subunit alcohol dehydrogenase family)
MQKYVLITGAGRGLGLALAKQFHQKGWHVIATDSAPEQLSGMEQEEGYTSFQMDVTSDQQVQAVFQKMREARITLDLIINNAGIDRYFPLSEAPVAHFQQIFAVNVFGACRVSQVFLPLLKKPGGGIMAIGSESLHITMPFLSYPITKRALENFTLALRQELQFSGRWATVVRCGPMRTAMLENVYHLKSEVEGTSLDPVFRNFAAAAPHEVGRVMDPSDVARRIWKIATSARPRGIYRINNGFRLRMLKWLPFGVVERVVRRRLA